MSVIGGQPDEGVVEALRDRKPAREPAPGGVVDRPLAAVTLAAVPLAASPGALPLDLPLHG
ncbi:MAG: hypothetical protein ACYSUN_05565, partial [Planctomycetota bacterium]